MENLNKFVGGYKEEEIEQAVEQEKKLNAAAVALMQNEDFKLIYNHYTVEKVLDESMKATMAPDHRHEMFEGVINSNAFKIYIEDLLARTPNRG